jgi:hypothetical protein
LTCEASWSRFSRAPKQNDRADRAKQRGAESDQDERRFSRDARDGSEHNNKKEPKRCPEWRRNEADEQEGKRRGSAKPTLLWFGSGHCTLKLNHM